MPSRHAANLKYTIRESASTIAFTGQIISHFEEALSACAALIMFIPMLMDTGGNAGGQASVTVIRGLSLGEITYIP